MKKINIREFNRNMYSYLDDFPFVVYNKHTKEIVFVVVSEKKGGELYEKIRTKDFI